MWGGIVRVLRPTLSTSPSRPCAMRTTAASHAMRREVSAHTLTPSSSRAPVSPVSTSVAASVCTTTWNRSALAPDAASPNPAASARSATMPAASARRCSAAGRASGSSCGRSRRSRPRSRASARRRPRARGVPAPRTCPRRRSRRELPAPVADLLGAELALALHALPPAHEGAKLHGGAAPGVLEQLLLGLGRGDARDLAPLV